MRKVYGSVPAEMPEGYAFKVHFPVLCLTDTETGDHRRLEADGGSSREGMPHQIRFQPAVTYGHDGALPVGALFEIEIDTDTNIASGTGFILDEPMGLLAAKMIKTKTQHKNSVDLADIKAEYIEDMDDWSKWYINFTQWAIGATTLVGTPAFATAHAEIVAALMAGGEITASMIQELREDEIVASMLAEPEMLVCDFPEGFEVHFEGEVDNMPEMTADGATRTPYEHFFTPEAAQPTKISSPDGVRVFGHLGLWNTCHDGMPSCVTIPRPQDAYASFNKPGALTDRGQIQTGPIFALGGHRTLIGKITPEDEANAYGGIENTWCDVRVIEGVHGPWLSGCVRPGTDPDVVYAALASRISGHWKGGKLKAIVSVNAEGYDVPGEPEMAAAYFGTAADGEMELVASFPGCFTTPKQPDVNFASYQITPEAKAEIAAAVVATLKGSAVDLATVGAAEDAEKRRLMLALLLQDDGDEDEPALV